jgi:3-hydroxyisobutyrate dehydrogenase-like beta-hydroxyacid dehydrogenase
MSDVTVIGLGNMGSALARAFVEKGCSVTVWNRSPEKAASLVVKGALLASDAAAAIAASPLVVMCVINQAAARQILIQNEDAFPGKLLVQLTSSTPQEARMGEAWA